MRPRTTILVSSLALLLASGVGGCMWTSRPKLESIRAEFNIKIQDPLVKQIAAATKLADIKATGEFAPGTYIIENTPVTIDEGTSFLFSLEAPIENSDYINTKTATGKLQTSKPLKIRGVSMPQIIVLKEGRVTTQVDLVQLLGSFVLNMLQMQTPSTAEGGQAQSMLRSIHIPTALFKLRPDAILAFGKNRIHTIGDSSIELADLTVDKDLDYRGTCRFRMNFANDCIYSDDHVDARFNGGSLLENVAVERKNSILTLKPLPQKTAPKLTLADCTYHFGREKKSSAHCDTSIIRIKQFDWSNFQSQNTPSQYHFDAALNATGTHLTLDNPTYTVDGILANTESASLKAYNDKQGHGLEFATQDIMAHKAAIKIKRPKTSIDLELLNAKLGSIAFTKSGDVSFELAEGASELHSFQWSTGKKTFKLSTDGGAHLSIPKGMAMAISSGNTGVHGKIPLSVKLGNASLGNASGSLLDLSQLKGDITVNLDQEVSLTGTTDFVITESKLLGDSAADVKVKGFNLTLGERGAVMHLNGCSVIMPRGAITALLKKQLPAEKSFDLNQEIFEEKKWRYKHGVITKLTVRNPEIQKLTLVAPNKANFAVDGDVEVDGTVEKTGILQAFKKNPSKWVTKNWNATSKCSGTGAITFALVPHNNLADSDLQYDVNLKLPLPQNIAIDLSGVSSGLVRAAETSVISGYLNKCEPFHGGRTIPLDRKGTIKLFESPDSKLKSIHISKFGLKPASAGTEIDFVGDALL